MRQIPPNEDHAQSAEELSSADRKTASPGLRAQGHEEEENERGHDGAAVADPRRLREAVFGTAEDTQPQRIPEESIAANTEEEEKPSLWARIKHSAVHGEQRKKPSRSSQRQNKTPTLLGAGALLFGFAIWLLFLVSSPVRKPPIHRAPAPSAANTQQPAPPRSSTPTTESQTQEPQAAGASDRTVTPADIRATAGNRPQETPQPAVHAPAKNSDTDAYALGKIPPPPASPATASAAPPPAAAGARKNPLDETSLVFVLHPKQRSAPQTEPRTQAVSWTPAFAEEPRVFADLPEGARLVARLETPASTAVALPVVAEIEYNYDGRDGYLLIPAGSKVFGTLEQADAQGFVGLHFTSLQRPSDPEPLPFEARAIGLDYRPLKGIVTGRHRGRRFLVRAASGIGSVAAATVGMNRGTGLSDGLSNNVLIREQVMNNIGSAGDQELQQLAYNRHTVVTVPGDTRFYLVIDHQAKTKQQQHGEGSAVRPAEAKPASGISMDEMRQLIGLQRELNQAAQPPNPPGAQETPQAVTVPAEAGAVSPEKPQ